MAGVCPPGHITDSRHCHGQVNQQPDQSNRRLDFHIPPDTKLHQDNKISYHTHALPEEKTLKILLRGIPSSIEKDTVKN